MMLKRSIKLRFIIPFVLIIIAVTTFYLSIYQTAILHPIMKILVHH